MLHKYFPRKQQQQHRHSRVGLYLLFVTLVGVYVALTIITHEAKQQQDISNNRWSMSRYLICHNGALRNSLVASRRSLCAVETKLENETFATAFATEDETSYEADENTTRPSGNTVGFVVTIPSCEDDDPSFYDRAAVLRDSICNCTAQNPDSNSAYGGTMYAILHPQAIHCPLPTGSSSNSRRLTNNSSSTYDRVAVLEELGYWVILWAQPLSLPQVSNANIRSQIMNSGGDTRDLMRLYAYNLTNHAAVIMVDFDTVFLTPVDTLVDELLDDYTTKAIYVSENGLINDGMVYIKPDESEFDAIMNSYQSTSYSNAWGSSSISNVDTAGILTYYYMQDSVAYKQKTSMEHHVLSFASNPACGKPWLCTYEESWSNATREECQSYHSAWFGYRKHFEEENWSMSDTVDTSQNDYHTSFFLGYCTQSGEEGYQGATTNGGGPPPIACPTCLNDGLVGYWSFDTLANGYVNSTDSSIVVRGVSPATSSVGVDASITGNGQDPPLVDDGKFGSALQIPSGVGNYAQIAPSGLFQDAPLTGFAGAIWLKPETNPFSNGIVWERMYNNFDLRTEPGWSQETMNRIGCRVRGSNAQMHTLYYPLGEPVDPSRWYHVVCSYNANETLTIYVDGVPRASSVVSLGGAFTHGSYTPLGLGNRASTNPSNPGQSSGNSHFIGSVDDFGLWDRHLDADEVAALYASDKALSRQEEGYEPPTPAPVLPSAAPTPVATGSPTKSPTTIQYWSDPTSWPSQQIPDDGDDVTIPSGVTMVVDLMDIPPSGSLGVLTIEGNLVNPVNNSLSLSAESIIVADTGTLQIGTADDPYVGQATITLTGIPDASTTSERSADNAQQNDGSRRALLVNGGSLILNADTPSVVKTKLNAHAGAGTNTFTLADNVSWKAGDRIAISTTDYYWGERHYNLGDSNFAQTEILTVAVDTNDGNQVETIESLGHNRWGAMQYVTNNGMSLVPGLYDPPSPDSATFLDERAQVVHLSRKIVIQGANDMHWNDSGFGAHVLVSGMSSSARVEGVQFLRGGQRRTMGRYPFHWHMISASTGTNIPVPLGSQFLHRSVILQSENRAVTIHGTSGVSVDTTFAVDIQNHAFFFEDGSERGNNVTECVAMKVRNRLNEHLKNHDRTPSGFWLTNPDNRIVGNTASDIQGVGLWNAFSPTVFGDSAQAGIDMNPASFKILSFDNNVAHSCGTNGIRTEDPVINEAGDTQPRSYRPLPDSGEDQWTFTMDRNIIWKCNEGGYNNRVGRPTYSNWIVADNTGRDIFGATSHQAQMFGTLFISQSLNDANTHLDIPNQPWNYQPRRRGVASYHFSVDIANVTAIGYHGVDVTNDTLSPQIVPNGQFVYGPGFIDLSDLYVTSLSLGTWRCGGWKLIDSNAGYQTRTMASTSPNDDPHDGFPRQVGNRPPPMTYRHWTLSGATWDPHGYWGPAGNYILATPAPFFTYELSSSSLGVPPGTFQNPINGISTPDTFMGFEAIRPFSNLQWYSGSTDVSMTMHRLDSSGGIVDSLYIGDDCSSSILHFRHYALKSGGIYRLELFTDTYSSSSPTSCTSAPEGPQGVSSSYSIVNGYRPADSFLVGLPWPASSVANVQIDSWGGITDQLSSVGMNSFSDIRDSSTRSFWQDTSNDLVWVKHYGGLDPVPDVSTLWSDHDLARYHMIRISV